MSKWISEGDWIYEILPNETECAIREYKGKSENIVVPEQCGGYPVTTFGNDVSCVFINAKIQTVILPSTIIKITNCAFLSCMTLKQIALPAGLHFIGKNAFYNCSSLKDIELPNNISCIKSRTFCCCESLISLTIPSSVKVIESMSFLGCQNLKQINLCEGIQIIEHHAFGLTSIAEVILPNSITSVQDNSFDEDTLIKNKCIK